MSSRATTTVIRTEARLFGRELGSLFWIVLFPVALLAILGAIPSMREPKPDLGGQRIVDLYTSVSILLAIIVASIFAMPSVIASYRERGILRRLRTTPVHPGTLLLAQVLVHAAAVLTSVVLVVAVARLAFDVPLPGNLAWYAGSVLLATVASFAIGAVITAVSPNARLAQTFSMIVFFPAMFTAGVYLPVQTMTGRLHDIVVATPLGAAAEALNDTRLGGPPDIVDMAVTLGWAVALALVAVRSFRWS